MSRPRNAVDLNRQQQQRNRLAALPPLDVTNNISTDEIDSNIEAISILHHAPNNRLEKPKSASAARPRSKSSELVCIEQSHGIERMSKTVGTGVSMNIHSSNDFDNKESTSMPTFPTAIANTGGSLSNRLRFDRNTASLLTISTKPS